MNAKEIINKFKTILQMEVKLESMMLADGQTVLEANMFEAGQEVFIKTVDEQMIPLPVGDYELESGQILVVIEEGIIAEIKDAEVEEEMPVEAPAVEEEVEAKAEAPKSAPKKTVETTTKETHFSSEEVEALKAEIESLKTELASIKEVKEVELSTEEIEPKKIEFNPENKIEKSNFQFGSNKMETIEDRIRRKLFN
jgi:hypothetical protein